MTVDNALANGFSEVHYTSLIQCTHLYYMYTTAVSLHTMSDTVSILLMKRSDKRVGWGEIGEMQIPHSHLFQHRFRTAVIQKFPLILIFSCSCSYLGRLGMQLG